MKRAELDEIADKIFRSHQVEVRDVEAGEEPFVYSTGNRGPGYLMIKGLVGQRKVLKFLTMQLALRVAELYGKEFDFVEGNATGGMIPAWQLTDDIEKVLDMEEGSIPFAYLCGSRKRGGHGEHLTGDRNNDLFHEGMKGLVVEELVNYAGTTSNAALALRDMKYGATNGACLLTYDHPESNKRLADVGLTLNPLITLPQLLDIGEANREITSEAVTSYREFLGNPVKWQLERGLVIPETAVGAAESQGYSMRKLELDEARELGAPMSKVEEGVVYWAKQ
tara:strand:+ start:4330 stop:5169 length:840 start_codon:yes stop_codon:yes gene_type:complete